jgi:hypothetical protein
LHCELINTTWRREFTSATLLAALVRLVVEADKEQDHEYDYEFRHGHP